MRINQEGNKPRMFAASEVKKTGSASGAKEEKRVNGLAVNQKEESEGKPKSLLEKLMVQKKDINDQMNQLRSGWIGGKLEMTEEQFKDRINELTTQLSAVDQAMVQERERMLEELKEQIKEQKEKREVELKKDGQSSENTEGMTEQEVVAKNVNRSVLSASMGIQNLKMINNVKKTQDHRINIVKGEMKLTIAQGGGIDAKLDELKQLNEKAQYDVGDVLEMALAPLKDIPWKKESSDKKEDSVAIDSQQDKEIIMPNRNQTPKSEVISDNLPNSTSAINYLV